MPTDTDERVPQYDTAGYPTNFAGAALDALDWLVWLRKGNALKYFVSGEILTENNIRLNRCIETLETYINSPEKE